MKTKFLSDLLLDNEYTDSYFHFEIREEVIEEEEDDVSHDMHLPELIITSSQEDGSSTKLSLNLCKFSNLVALRDLLNDAIGKFENGKFADLP